MFNNEFTINKDKIKAIIFDFDGVILDSVNIKTDAFRELFNNYSLEIQEKIVSHHIRNGGMSRFDKIKFYFKEYVKEKLTEEKYEKYLQSFQDIVLKKVLKCNFIKGSYEFLNNNKDNFMYFVVSATPEQELNNILVKRNIDSFFIKTYGSPLSKEVNINTLLDEYNLTSKEVLYIGDSINDYEACIKTNILFIGV